jgi:hypothetical protein
MTYRQIETSREIRLWVTQVIIPALGMATALAATVPEFREAVTTKAKEVKNAIKSKLQK